MQVIPGPGAYTYIASTGDWRLLVGGGTFAILPQVGGFEYSSGVNLDNLAALIVSAKTHAVANGIDWSGS
jgi:hypothetical protein